MENNIRNLKDDSETIYKKNNKKNKIAKSIKNYIKKEETKHDSNSVSLYKVENK